MEEKAVRGIPWTVLSYAVTKTVTVASTIVLARLLEPRDFGIVALGLLAVESLTYLASLGLGPALIVRHDVSPAAPGTALSLMVLTGVISGALLAAASSVIAAAFAEPDLAPVLTALACLLPLGGLTSFYATILQRELEFFRRFATLATQALANVAVALSLAAAGAGVWSLVFGQLAGYLGYAVALLLLTPYRVRPAFDRRAARALCSGGLGFVLQGSASFLQQNLDYLVVGRVLGAPALGIYGMAFRLSELPYYAVADPVAQVTFPAFARMRARGEDLRQAFLSTLQTVALISVPFGLLLAAASRPFTEALLGDRWLPMVGPLSVLGLWGAVRPLQTMFGWLLNSVGHARVVGVLSVAAAALLVPSLVIAADLGGITAVAWVMFAGVLVFLAALARTARRRLGIGARLQWRAVRPAVLAGVPTWVATRLVVAATGGAPSGVTLAAATVVSFGVYVLAVSVVERGLLRRVVGDVRRMLRPPAPSPSLDEVP